MSHSATIWALQQRGLTPAQRVVLFYLADRHNPDYGCFPKQNTLAADAEISVSSLNDHLAYLEERGLIRRERRIHPETRRQMSTRYILGFETGFATESAANDAPAKPDPVPNSGDGTTPDPTPESGDGNAQKPSPKIPESRLRNSETNLVKEPVRTTTARATEGAADSSPQGRCLAAAGRGLCPAGRQAIVGTAEVIDGWLTAGFDLDLDVLPVIASRTVSMRISPIRTWAYFSDAVAEAHRIRVAKAAKGQNAENSMVPCGTGGADRSVAGADGNDVNLHFFADWVNGDKYLPSNAITNRMAGALLRAGLVSRERMRARGVPFVQGGR